jgi:hypothetical protein
MTTPDPTAQAEIERLRAELEKAHEAIDANWVTHQRVTTAEARVRELEAQVVAMRQALLHIRGRIRHVTWWHKDTDAHGMMTFKEGIDAALARPDAAGGAR